MSYWVVQLCVCGDPGRRHGRRTHDPRRGVDDNGRRWSPARDGWVTSSRLMGKGNSPLAMAIPLTMAAVMDPLDDGSRRWIPARDVRGWQRARPGDGSMQWMGKYNSRRTMAAGDRPWTD